MQLEWTKATDILKCINSIYDTVMNVNKYIGLDSQSAGRYDHKDSQEFIEAIFSPEANVNEISDDMSSGSTQKDWAQPQG